MNDLFLSDLRHLFAQSTLANAIHNWLQLDDLPKFIIGKRFGLYGHLPMDTKELGDELGFSEAELLSIEETALKSILKII